MKNLNEVSPTSAEMQKFFAKDEKLVYKDLSIYPDDSLYRGQVDKVKLAINGQQEEVELRQGYGVRLFKDGSKYEGNWHQNMPNG